MDPPASDAPANGAPPTATPAKHRRLFRLVIVVFGMALALVALEATARVMRLGGDDGGLVPNPFFDHWHPESFRAPAWSPHGDWGGHDMVTNSEGFMQADELPPADTPSIVFVGDSFVEGRQVAEQARFVTRVGAALKEPALNFGCSSFSPLLCRIQLEQFEDRIAPRAVVLVLFANDFSDENGYRRRAEKDADGRAVAVVGAAGSAWRRVARRSALYRFVRLVWKSRGHKRVDENPDTFPRWFSAPLTEQIPQRKRDFIEKSLDEINAWCAERGARFVLAAVPDQGALVQENEDRVAEYAAAIAAARGFEYVDLAAAFRADGRKRGLFLRTDSHFNEAGHEVAAAAFAEALR
jgi:lysophospholipase L1-like esterase